MAQPSEVLSSDPTSILGAEKYCSGSDRLGFPEPTQRRHRHDLVAKLWRNKTQLVQSFCLYHARIDRINANAIGTELQRKRGSNGVNSSFASSVYGGTCRRMSTRERANIKHAAIILLHLLYRFLDLYQHT